MPYVVGAACLAFLWLAPAVRAQEEEPRFGLLHVTQPAMLRSAPGTTAGVLRALAVGTTLRWLDGQQSGSFMRVVGADGPVGWVRASQVAVDAPPEAAGALTAQPPCESSLSDCGTAGCAQAGTTQALFNRQKRKAAATGTAVALTFPDFVSLQTKADALVGQGQELDATERAKLKTITVAGKSTGEGKRVRIVGFLAPGLPPNANTGESVNCRLTGVGNNDFHLSLVRTKTGSRFKGVVAEMVPQQRPAAWTLAALKTIQQAKRKVMVEGNLFYDNHHVVNSDASHPIGGQPARASLWEIHRIAKFWSCEQADGSCDPTKPSEWKELK